MATNESTIMVRVSKVDGVYVARIAADGGGLDDGGGKSLCGFGYDDTLRILRDALCDRAEEIMRSAAVKKTPKPGDITWVRTPADPGGFM